MEELGLYLVSFRKLHFTGDFCLGGHGSDPLGDVVSGDREVVEVLQKQTKLIPENWRRSGKQEGGGHEDTATTGRQCNTGSS